MLKILEKQDVKTPHILQAAAGSDLEGQSQSYTELTVALTQNSRKKNAVKYSCSQSPHMQDSKKKKCQHLWCQGPQLKPREASELFSFYSSYQC